MKRRLLVGIGMAIVLEGCTVGPDYVRPPPDAPARWSTPSATRAPPIADDWWRRYEDPVLDRLVDEALVNNQDLAIAVTRFDAARAILGAASAERVPHATLNGSHLRGRTSADVDNRLPFLDTTVRRLTVDASYEVDLWGRVRRSVAAARADLEAAGSAHDALQLGIVAETVGTYVQVVSLDREIDALRRAVELREASRDLVRARLQAGAVSDLDALRADGELAQARADLSEVARQRERATHALATLLGRAPNDFAVAAAAPPAVPDVPAGLPADLIDRRPDIDQGERQLAAASERIGVAESARFPTIRLTAFGGAASSDLSMLTSRGSAIWGIGPAIGLPLFDGGRIESDIALADARFREAAIAWRRALLIAYREVEDALTDGVRLGERAADLRAAVDAAKGASALARLRYERGASGYLDVIDAERAETATERLAIQNERARLLASVSLVKALGGGWSRDRRGMLPEPR